MERRDRAKNGVASTGDSPATEMHCRRSARGCDLLNGSTGTSVAEPDQVGADVTPMMIFEEFGAFLVSDAGRPAVACCCNMLRSVAP
jgi:hypothetical protein